MSSGGRRPPPPPPPDDDDDDDGSLAPPLPPNRPLPPEAQQRGKTSGKTQDEHVPALPARQIDKRPGTLRPQQQPPQQQQEDYDATYEEPTTNSNTNMTSSAGGGTSFTPSSLRPPDNSDSDNDGWYDEFDEEEDAAAVVRRSHEQDEGPQPGDLYVEPDGVPKDGPNGDCSKKNVIPHSGKFEQPKTDKKPNPPSKPTFNIIKLLPQQTAKLGPQQTEKIKPPPTEKTKPPPTEKTKPPQPEPKPIPTEKQRKPLPKTPDQRMESPGAPTDAKPKNKPSSLASNSVEHKQPVVADAGVYDDGSSESLSHHDWFHGELDREEAARRVRQLSENGAFLVRASMNDSSKKTEVTTHPYTLVVTSDSKLYNLMIRLRQDGRFAIGKFKEDEVSFPNVPELIKHHMENNIKLTEGGLVKLKRSPKK